jgi:formate dehydrogenase iron-sulfur subunit
MATIEARPVGFFTDTSICIGCKACEVACKEWNQLEGNKPEFLADSFDNTGQLDAQNWRHVQFHETIPSASGGANDGNGNGGGAGVVNTPTAAGGQAWLMLSDVCKHCQQASCLEVCPTDAIVRTEFDTVLIQQSVCNGCRDCISACPYGVIGFNEKTGTAHKCTMCYDRLQNGMQPACAKACPTESIKFGYLDDLHAAADKRLAALQQGGFTRAQLYGRDASVYGGLNAFFLLMDKPETYALPSAENARLPSRNNIPGYVGGAVTAIAGLFAGVLAFRSNRMSGMEKRP